MEIGDFGDVDSLMQSVHSINARRTFLSKHPIVCPKCKDRQVQLLEIKFLPKWKCRECGYTYRFEPIMQVKCS